MTYEAIFLYCDVNSPTIVLTVNFHLHYTHTHTHTHTHTRTRAHMNFEYIGSPQIRFYLQRPGSDYEIRERLPASITDIK